MRMLLFFDLPVVEAQDRSAYTRFHTFLIKSGFMMLQQSVYCKLVNGAGMSEAVCRSLHKNKPPKGQIALLTVTEKQYARMDLILGEHTSNVVDSEERLLIL